MSIRLYRIGSTSSRAISALSPVPVIRRYVRISATVVAAMSAIAAHAQTYTLTTLGTFNGSNGAYSLGGMTIDASGNVYGTTATGGTNGNGTVFKIAAGTNMVTTLATFTGTANGVDPSGKLAIDSSGNLYGTAIGGGANFGGTVYKIAAGTSTLTTIISFDGANNTTPYGGVTLDSSGNLFGTTEGDTSHNDGTVYEIAAGTNTVTTLATFTGIANGSTPFGNLVIDSSGNLYGTTSGGGASNDGTVFKIAAGTNTLTTLATFTGTNGMNPDGGLTLDSSGNLYGTTQSGGASNDGTVFKIAVGTNTLTTLVTFTGTANGSGPSSSLTLDSSGNLYGTTTGGGTNNEGTVFKLAAGASSAVGEGAFTTIAAFDGTNGMQPQASVAIDGSGNIYGTTNEGGANSFGTVFKLTPSGSAAAPEPSALVLLAPGAFGWIVIRRASRKANWRSIHATV